MSLLAAGDAGQLRVGQGFRPEPFSDAAVSRPKALALLVAGANSLRLKIWSTPAWLEHGETQGTGHWQESRPTSGHLALGSPRALARTAASTGTPVVHRPVRWGVATNNKNNPPGPVWPVPAGCHVPGAREATLLPLGSTRVRWEVGWVTVTTHGGGGEEIPSERDGQPLGQGFADRGVAAWIPSVDATREVCSSCERPACCPLHRRPPICGSGAGTWSGLGGVSRGRSASTAGAPEGCFRRGARERESRVDRGLYC